MYAPCGKYNTAHQPTDFERTTTQYNSNESKRAL